MEKLKRQAGESLVELLLSMLIISLGMLMLAGAITTTARLNAKAREMSTRTVVDNTTASEIKINVMLGNVMLGDELLKNGVTVTIVRSGNNKELYYYG